MLTSGKYSHSMTCCLSHIKPSLLIGEFLFTHGSLQEGKNMQLNEDTCESNMHNELKIIYIKEEEPQEDEYLCERCLSLNNTS